MGDLRARLKPLFRRSSTPSSPKSPKPSLAETPAGHPLGDGRNWSKTSLRLAKNRKPSTVLPVDEIKESPPQLPPLEHIETESLGREGSEHTPDTSIEAPQSPILEKGNPTLTVEEPTPKTEVENEVVAAQDPGLLAEPDARNTIASQRPGIAHRRQSLAPSSQSSLINELLQSESPQLQPTTTDYFGEVLPRPKMPQHKKIWVKRPGSSATQVTIYEDDLVDDVRDMILKKYANSLGRNFDAPDVTLRIVYRHPSGRHSQTERTLGPEEPVSKVLEVHYPGGQSVEEALVIDVPQRRTPKHSPHLAMPYYLHDDLRPRENGTDYFPPMPVAGTHSPHLQSSISVSSAQGISHHPAHAMAVLTTGQLPNLPSPGARVARNSQHRPKYGRQHTSSPTILQGAANAQNHENLKYSNPAPMPTPPIPEESPSKAATPPIPRVSSPGPRPKGLNNKRSKKHVVQTSTDAASVRDGAVPPINVLIVEDNIINLRLLEAFMKRLKVRWSTAMNGKDAVTKWREGGFHLVLMDIQLPVMNGLDATKEIRRLERVNSIGVFSNSASTTPTFANGDEIDQVPEEEDSLMNTALFKSPVIIVALTASSLQSDRHEALAAGCNDFLTKPVNFEWLTRKVMEWGCMQALIDFDGWRKWKDFSSQSNQNNKPSTSTPLLGIKSPKSSSSAKELANTNANNANNANNVNGKVVSPSGGGMKKKKEEREGMHLGLVGKEKVVGVHGVDEGLTRRERDGSDETMGTGTGTGTDTNGDSEGK